MFVNNFNYIIRRLLFVPGNATSYTPPVIKQFDGTHNITTSNSTNINISAGGIAASAFDTNLSKACQQVFLGTKTLTDSTVTSVTSFPNLTKIGIIVGSDNTATTVDDSTIKTPIANLNSDWITAVASDNSSAAGGVNSGHITITVPNDGTAVEVGELGVVCSYTTTLASAAPCMMIARETLPEKITVNPGETKTFTLSLDCSKFVG